MHTEPEQHCSKKHRSILDRFPPAVILHVADLLPTESAASFALCSKRLKALLSSKHWGLLSSLGSEGRIRFLTMLSRDLPRYHACHGCIRLHQSNTVPWPADRSVSSLRVTCNPGRFRNVAVSYYRTPYKLRFSHVQLVLKQHRHGRDHGMPLKDLSHTDVVNFLGIYFMFSVDARVVSDELILRSQDWILTGAYPRREFSECYLSYHGVCNHQFVQEEDIGYEGTFTDLFIRRTSPNLAERDRTGLKFHGCPHCPVDYQIDLVDLGKLGPALCITKWTNLGAGNTAHDWKWQAHDTLWLETTRHNLPPGCTRKKYESQEETSLGELTAKNEKRLVSSFERCGNCINFKPLARDWERVDLNRWNAKSENRQYEQQPTLGALAEPAYAGYSVQFLFLVGACAVSFWLGTFMSWSTLMWASL